MGQSASNVQNDFKVPAPVIKVRKKSLTQIGTRQWDTQHSTGSKKDYGRSEGSYEWT